MGIATLGTGKEDMSSIEKVVSHGSCGGCSGCEVATGRRISVKLPTKGEYEADLSRASEADKLAGSRVCPFSEESRNEDQISYDLYPHPKHDQRTGRLLSTFAVRIHDDEEITRSSSGGMTTWILVQLLAQADVDGGIHVGDTLSPLFGCVVSRNKDELLAGRKSKYHPASFGEVLQSIKGDGLQDFAGVPCAVRSARLVAEEDSDLGSQFSYFVGIVCGHLKSTAYAEAFAWQLGVEPENIETVDFRLKDPALTARQYAFGVKDKRDGKWREKQTLSLVGGSCGHAVFQLNACNYCDDVFAETADVVIGDAWLSKYEIDWLYTNVVLTRNAQIEEILKAGAAENAFMHDGLDIDATASTQQGNFRHRRDGLAVRLADDDAAGVWHPPKRVETRYDHMSPERIELIRQRRHLSEVTHDGFARAKDANDLGIYLDVVEPLIEQYQGSTKVRQSTRIRNKAQREMWKLVQKERSGLRRGGKR